MSRLRFLSFFWLSLSCLSWTWNNLSLKRSSKPAVQMKTVWAVDTVRQKNLRPQLILNSSPLIVGPYVIQGNSIDGIKAYRKSSGELFWDFKITGGVASPVVFYKGNLYFGGSDGFFYSLQLKSGNMNWKYWTGRENLGPPLIHKSKIYWSDSSQKMYALDLKGTLIWLYPGPSASKTFIVKGRPRPVVYKNWIYMGFYDGSLVSLNKETGRLKFQLALSPSHPIREDLHIKGNCLFVPSFDSHLFCLNPLNGKILWKRKGGSSSYLLDEKTIYQSHKDWLYAFKWNAKPLWRKKLSAPYPLPPSVLKNYLIYGFPSKGELAVAGAKDGKTLELYSFGRGLAGSVTVDAEERSIYFLSADSWLHKVSIL